MNPQTGEFMSMDSFEGHRTDPLSLHKYLFVKGDGGINLRDPKGHDGTAGEQVTAAGVEGNLSAAEQVSQYEANLLKQIYRPATAALTTAGGGLASAILAGSQELYHYTTTEGAAFIEEGVDIARSNVLNRFGQGFYMSVDPEVAMAETRSGAEVLLKVQISGANVLDLTNQSLINKLNYVPSDPLSGQRIGAWALQNGYDAIRFFSAQVSGAVNWVIINQSKVPEVVQSVTRVQAAGP